MTPSGAGHGRLEAVASGLSFPTSLAFDSAGVAYVAEAGLPFGGAAPGGRVWRLEPGGERRLLAEGLAPPVNGLTFHDDGLYVSEAGPPGRISRLELDGHRTVIVDGLPGPGNYHTNMAAFGADGRLYFSLGAMTNSGIIGLDAYELGWLRRLPHAHDLPGHDLVLAGVNVETPDPLSAAPGARATTGAFVPFGTPTEPGQRLPAQLPCTAAVMRCDPDGQNLELVAWGLRNAYGIGFLPDRRLLAIDQGADEPRDDWHTGTLAQTLAPKRGATHHGAAAAWKGRGDGAPGPRGPRATGDADGRGGAGRRRRARRHGAAVGAVPHPAARVAAGGGRGGRRGRGRRPAARGKAASTQGPV